MIKPSPAKIIPFSGQFDIQCIKTAILLHRTEPRRYQTGQKKKINAVDAKALAFHAQVVGGTRDYELHLHY